MLLFMEKEAWPGKVLVYQALGFLAIIAVCLLDEVVGLSSLILGNQSYICNFRETIIKMVIVLGVFPTPLLRSLEQPLNAIRHAGAAGAVDRPVTPTMPVATVAEVGVATK